MAAITVLQLSDLHLLPHAGDRMYGVDTEAYFSRVLEFALAREPNTDLILLTGDLTQEPCLDSYRRLAARLEPLNIPCLCLPGNHDDFELMQQGLNTGRVSCDKRIELDGWQIIQLNSRIPGRAGGRLDREELEFAENCLKNASGLHALIAVHHHCQPVESAWMDTIMIENGDELMALLHRYPQAKAVVCGHVHQEWDRVKDGIRLLGVPSTCFQFAPNSPDFSLDDSAPGYRVLRLRADGALDTDVFRLPGKLEGLQPVAGVL